MQATRNRFEQFIKIVTLGLVFVISSITPPADPDMWWHLSAGRAMWERGEILTHDIFSYTRVGMTWTNAFWMADLGMYFLQSRFGFWALVLVASALAVLTMWLVFAQIEGPVWIRSGITVLAMVAAFPAWSTRPQLISYFFIAGLDYFLSKRDNGPRQRFWLLIPLFALWANLHGGFIWGFLLLFAYLAGKVVDLFFMESNEKAATINKIGLISVIGLLCVIAIGLNPNGLSLWKLPFYTVDISLKIQEWLSPDFHTFLPHPMLWLLFLLVVGLGYSRKMLSPFELFKTLGFAYLTFFSQRNMAPFAILAAPVVGKHLSNAWELLLQNIRMNKPRQASKPVSEMGAKLINIVAILAFVFAATVNAILKTSPERLERGYPVEAVKWLKQNHPEGRMFNSYNWGGYLTWVLPEYPVFIDGRADLYGGDMLQEWMDVATARGDYKSALTTWDINLVFLEPGGQIITELKRSGWTIAFEDKTAVILTR